MARLTADTVTRLQAERSVLINVTIPKACEDVLLSRSAGDIAENNDFVLAKGVEALLQERLRVVEALLDGAEVVAAGDLELDVVGTGVVVTVDFGGGDTERFLVGSIEEAHGGVQVLTPTSPLGAALLGAKLGETVSYGSPAGVQKVTVAAITPD